MWIHFNDIAENMFLLVLQRLTVSSKMFITLSAFFICKMYYHLNNYLSSKEFFQATKIIYSKLVISLSNAHQIYWEISATSINTTLTATTRHAISTPKINYLAQLPACKIPRITVVAHIVVQENRKSHPLSRPRLVIEMQILWLCFWSLLFPPITQRRM